MSLRLKNQQDPKKTLGLNKETWARMLEMAEEYGWNPLGTIQPDRVAGEPDPAGYDPSSWSDGSSAGRLVLFEDALNLADALERAFLEHEPGPVEQDSLPARTSPTAQPLGIGVIIAALEFCRDGAFWIENQA